MSSYFDTLFDYNRHGFNHIAVRILLYLDYKSFIQVKRTNQLLYEFIKRAELEDIVLRRKLAWDWQYNSPKISLLREDLTIWLQCLMKDDINHVSFSDNSREVLISNVNCVSSIQTDGLMNKNVALPSGNKYQNNQENLEANIVTSFDVLLDKYLITGSKNGMLSFFDIRTGELESYKQLFGIISQVKCREDLIVTSHLGKAYDIGCISIRKFLSPTNMQVVWSVYEDVMPVFSMDFNLDYIVGLEWSETLNHAHMGQCSIYKRETPSDENQNYSWSRFIPLMDYNTRFTTCCLFKKDFLALGVDGVATGEHWDFHLQILDLRTNTMIHNFKAHKSAIFSILSCGDRLFTRDKDGYVYIWDQLLASDKSYKCDENYAVMIRRLSEENEKVENLCVDLRRALLFSKEGVNKTLKILDFWTDSWRE